MNKFEILQSLECQDGEFVSSIEFQRWFNERRNSVNVEITEIGLSNLRRWNFCEQKGNLRHDSGSFFAVTGIEVTTNFGKIENWSQPIILQNEIGILGFIIKRINGVYHFLVQCKIEPGNINLVQVSPTVQATKSNYLRVHGGKLPKYVEYFLDENKALIHFDQIQSEQGARYLKKRNRNLIVEVFSEIEIDPDYTWLSLGQLKSLLKIPNCVNMDSRTVLSMIDDFSDFNNASNADIAKGNLQDRIKLRDDNINSSFESRRLTSIFSWINDLKVNYYLTRSIVNLNRLRFWESDGFSISNVDNKYFSVRGFRVEISNREVVSWDQPLIVPEAQGLVAILVKKVLGELLVLVQAKFEPGYHEVFELGPSIQTSNWVEATTLNSHPFVNILEQEPSSEVLFNILQSEEGGRFYKEENIHRIIDVSNVVDFQLPDNFLWISIDNLYHLVRFSNLVNIQMRSLLSMLTLVCKEK